MRKNIALMHASRPLAEWPIRSKREFHHKIMRFKNKLHGNDLRSYANIIAAPQAIVIGKRINVSAHLPTSNRRTAFFEPSDGCDCLSLCSRHLDDIEVLACATHGVRGREVAITVKPCAVQHGPTAQRCRQVRRGKHIIRRVDQTVVSTDNHA